MASLNYFQWLCFFWAFVGLGSRLVMWLLGPKWKTWEIQKAYSQRRPPWVLVVIAGGVLLAVWTWYQVWLGHTALGWIMGVLVSLTLIKLGALLLRYDDFRAFARTTLHDGSKFAALNAAVVFVSFGFLAMGLFVY